MYSIRTIGPSDMTQPGKKDKERGLMEPRLEGRWDSMEKEERRTQQHVIDGFNRNSTIYAGDSIVRKTDTR